MSTDADNLVLNLGCGRDRFGDVRLDVALTPAANIIADAQHLPFREEAFTEIFERNLLEHIPNAAEHLVEVKRVLRRQGMVQLITDNAGCLKYYVLGTHTGGYSKNNGKDRHYALFTLEHVRNLLRLCGLSVEKLELIDTSYFTRPFDRFVRLFAPTLSYPRIFAEARKN
jgi:ubiquinone/menaquinone biosynthesis C-methylase UbiE